MYEHKLDPNADGKTQLPSQEEQTDTKREAAHQPAGRSGHEQSAPPAPGNHSLLQLQHRYGNRYVQRLVARAKEDAEETAVPSATEEAIRQKRGSGQPLDNGVREQMEPAFKADFGDVRVHNDAQADTLSRSLNARAFATGNDIFFRKGTYNPGSSGGRELLAHELTHVVQQGGSSVQRKLNVGPPDDKYEQEADQMARAISHQEQQANMTTAPAEVILRQGDEDEAKMKIDNESLQRQPEEEES